MKCSDCKRDFPDDLIHPFETGVASDDNPKRAIFRPIETVPMCPICAYRRMNAERGLPADTKPPRSAPKARLLYERAIIHVRDQSRQAM